MSKVGTQMKRAPRRSVRPRLYVIEEIDGRREPVIVTSSSIRAWARASKRELDGRLDPKSGISHRICVYRRFSVVS